MTFNSRMEPRLIKDWINEFAKLYAQSDRGRSPEEFWIATMAHCSGIGEAIRRVNYHGLMKAAAHAFCWMCCYVHYCSTKEEDLLFFCQHSLCDIVFFKFPDVCGHCRENPCKCDPFKMDRKKDKASNYKELLQKWREKRKPEGYKIDEWLNIFKDIFGGRNHLQTLESIGFHFLEEVGEEAKAVRQLIQLRGIIEQSDSMHNNTLKNISTIEGLVEEYSNCPLDDQGKPIINMASTNLKDIKTRIIKAKMDFIIELADTFSWFCAILIKISRIIENMNVTEPGIYDLDEFLQREYKATSEGLTCPTCKNIPCKCQFFSLEKECNEKEK